MKLPMVLAARPSPFPQLSGSDFTGNPFAAVELLDAEEELVFKFLRSSHVGC